jgi:hypothetical protein
VLCKGAVIGAGPHDPAARRKTQRTGRQRGCSIYIPAEWLEKAGWDPEGPTPYYTIAGGERGRYVVTLHRDGDPTNRRKS